jgi:hypothetical protein
MEEATVRLTDVSRGWNRWPYLAMRAYKRDVDQAPLPLLKSRCNQFDRTKY